MVRSKGFKNLFILFFLITSFIVGFSQQSTYQTITDIMWISKIVPVSDDEFVAVSRINTNSIAVNLLDKNHLLIWSKAYSWSASFGYRDIYQDQNKNIYLLGGGKEFSQVTNNDQVHLVSFSHGGDFRFAKNLTSGSYSLAGSILPYSDSSFLLINQIQRTAGHASLQLLVMDTLGNLLADKSFINDIWDIAYGGIQTDDGGCLVALSHAKSVSSGDDDDCGLVKFNHDLELEWAKTYGGPLRDRDDVRGTMQVVEAPDAYYFSTITYNYGAVNYDIALMKVDKTGNLIFASRVGTDAYDIVGTSNLVYHDNQIGLLARFDLNNKLLIFTDKGVLKHNYAIGESDQLFSIIKNQDKVIITGVRTDNKATLLELTNFDSLCFVSDTVITSFDVTNQVQKADFTFPLINTNYVVVTDFFIPFVVSNNWNKETRTICSYKEGTVDTVFVNRTIYKYTVSKCLGKPLDIAIDFCGICNWYDEAETELLLSKSSTLLLDYDVDKLIAIDPIKNNVKAEIEVIPEEEYLCNPLKIYELITPNGDLKNDNLKIMNLEYFSDVNVQVFDVRNQEVFKSSNYNNNWSFEGLENGVYYVSVSSNLLDKPIVAEVVLKR